MLIDRTHRSWALVTGISLAVAATLYAWYAHRWPGGPAGRSWPGMAFGIVGTALMAFAGLLSARKKTIRRRWGNLAWWLRGHIWLGLLSVPLVLFHAAFRWGGPLESLLWAVVAIVIISGAVGLALQNWTPKLMTTQLPHEFIADQLAAACQRLQQAEDEHVLAFCGEAAVMAAGNLTTVTDRAGSVDAQSELARFYLATVQPYLAASGGRGALADAREAQLLFERVRERLPFESQPVLEQLENACSQRRQINKQAHLHKLLHGWLWIHVPLSAALVVLVIIHVATALYY